ncbi:hypothetical protein TFLX_02376 [Thermoflexales bacterium]|nr:hypothetical protein TFLX_02376 [Thermoflexales bacterium]
MTSSLSLLLIFLAFVLSLTARNPLLLLLTVIVLIVAMTSWLWGKYCLAGISYTRRFETDRLFFGEEIDLWIELINAKPLPLPWLKAEDEFPQEMPILRAETQHSSRPQRRTLTNVYSLRWYEKVRRRYRLRGERRGAYHIGPVQLASGDLFGFQRRRLAASSVDTVLVYPKLVPLAQLSLPAARPLGDFGSERRVVDDPLRMAGARDYQAGDSVRHLHWKATAHRAALQTKQFDPSATPHWMICLNTQTLEHLFEGVVTDFLETAIVVAASLAVAGLEARRSVGLVANSNIQKSRDWVQLAASRHPQQSTRILEALAQLNSTPLLAFDQMLRLERPRLPYGASLFAVTSLLNENLLKALLDLRSKGHPVALILVGRQPDRPMPPDVPLYVVRENWTELKALHLTPQVVL